MLVKSLPVIYVASQRAALQPSLSAMVEKGTNFKNPFQDQRQLLSGRRVERIFDIGANMGQITATYRKLFPKALIYGFEPFPAAFREYAERFATDRLVRPVQQALTKENGTHTFFVNRNSATNSCLPVASDAAYWSDPPASEIENIATIEVPAITFDDFCLQQNLDTTQILKMDIQGGELLALQGATQQLARGSIDLIYTEILFVPLYKGQAFFYDIAAFLAGFGYTIFDIYNHKYGDNRHLKWADALFISPTIRDVLMKQSAQSRDPGSRGSDEAQYRDSAIATDEKLGGELRERLTDETYEREVDRLTTEVRELQETLRSVQNSIGWRMLNKGRTVRDRLAPNGSLRQKIYRYILNIAERIG
jgi:FkbM family methyltransferase